MIYPEEWEVKGEKEPPRLVRLDENSPEYAKAANCFLENFPVEICRIERVQNLELYRQYCSAKEYLSGQNINSSECLLKHGTEGTPPERVWNSGMERTKSHGFDFRFIKDGMYSRNRNKDGVGIVFTDSSLYANSFRYPPNISEGGEYQIFLCSVLIGKVEYRHEGLCTDYRRCSPGYNSIMGPLNRSNPRGIVIFSLNQVYPTYLITFRLPSHD